MSVRSTTAQFNNLRGIATRPITLIRWEYSGGLETISLSGDNIEFDGEIYVSAGVEMVSIDNNNSAVLSMVITDERMAQTLAGSWRGGKICQIYEIPALPEDDEFVYEAADGILKIDGIIDNSQYSNGKITVNVLHKYLVGKFTPRYRVNDFTTTVPVAGSFLKVGSSKYQLKSRRQKTTDRIKPKALRGRLTTSETNSFVQDDKALDTEMTADGAFMPVAFGRNPMPGMICANGVDGSGNYIYVVAWCQGPVLEIGDIYNNDVVLSTSAIVHNYRGIECQGVDNYAATITGLSYADDWRLLTPDGYACGAYSVIVLPASITEPPRFQAIVKGLLVYDIRQDGGSTMLDSTNFPDPFNKGDVLAVGYNLQFIGTNGTSPTTTVDFSSYAHTITYAGNAQIQSNKLSLDGDGDYVTVPSNTNTRWGSGKWTLEITCTPTVSGEINALFGVGDSASDRCILITQIATALYVSMSSTGSSWDIMNTVNVYNTAFAANTTTKIVIEYDELGYFFYVDGTQRYYQASTSDLYASTSTIYVGQQQGAAGTTAFKGSITGVRFTKGYNRYGGVHTATAFPYCDSDSCESGYVYTDIAAAATATLIKSPFFGLGSSEPITNLLNMFKHNETDLGSAVEHTMDLVISESRPTVEWIDQVCGTYGETFWFFEGDRVSLRPDRIADSLNPSGWEITTNGDFYDDASDWTLGSGWSYGGSSLHVLIGAATSGTVSQTMGKPTVEGDTYILTFSLDVVFAGTVRVDLDGVTVIDAKSVAGVYAYEFVATGDETTISMTAASYTGFVGELSVRRKFWRDDTIVSGSLQITPLKNSDAPNRLIATYRKIASGSANWGDDIPIVVEMPGVGLDGTPIIETRIRYDGLRSTSKTTYKAKAKLYRLQGKDTVSWKTTDIGLLYQKGMVVELYDSEFDLLIYVLLESVERVEQGRYLCRGTRYSATHHPAEQEAQAGTVPVGLILPLLGDTVPSGWQAYDTSPTLIGRYIKCAGESLALATRGGANTHSALTGNTSTDGAHGTDGDTFLVESYTGNSGAGSGRKYTAFNTEAGSHLHTYDTGTLTPDLYAADLRLVKKITSDATSLPDSVMAFGLAGLEYIDTHRYTALGKRLLRAASAWGTDGVLQQLLSLTTGSTNDSHDHETYSSVTDGSPNGTAITATHYDAVSGGGAHTHAVIVELLRNIARFKACLYASGDTYGMGAGMWGLWDGSLSSLHQDYSLCDGRLGTPFIEGRYIEIAASGDEDQRRGNNTLSVTGQTRWSSKHEHQGTADTADTYDAVEISHSDEVRHRHTITDPAVSTDHNDWEPLHHTLYPVMYNPNPVPVQQDVLLFVEGDMPNGETAIVDSSRQFLTGTIAGSGTMEYSSSQLLFGKNTVYQAATKRVSFACGDYGKKWSWEGFFRNNATGLMVLMSNYDSGDASHSVWIVKQTTGHIELYVGATSPARATISLSLTSNEWFYVSVCYDYAEFRLYAGKVSTGTATRAAYTSAAFSPRDNLTLFDHPAGFFGLACFTGYATQMRVIRGAALYSASVIPIPTEARQNWHSGNTMPGHYDWWDTCGIVGGYYTNTSPDLDPAGLPNNPGGRACLFQEVGSAAYAITVEWPGVHAHGQAGPMVCVAPDETEYAIAFYYDADAGAWTLKELGRQADDASVIDTETEAHVDGTAVDLSMQVTATDVTCKVNGITKITATIPVNLQGSTKAGVFVDVGSVEARTANLPCLVAPYHIPHTDPDWAFYSGYWDDAGYWIDTP